MDKGSPCQVVIDGHSWSGDPYCDEGTLNIDDLEADDIRIYEGFLNSSQFFHELPRDMCVLLIVREFSSSEIDHERIRNTYFENLN